ncbi:unnamed protein product [Phytomonas sp. Hart1]|nr:unnamed protein product [Phytomonas sp. Hart1]|eukprot:CCW68074.1 unnamed protein product [Phytomonas sp. isolate Hart1]
MTHWDSSFATVCFLNKDGSKESTLRVPIEDPATTTVRRLAKDAMRRLVAVLRRKEALDLKIKIQNTFSGSEKNAKDLPFTGVSRIFVGEELLSQVDIFGRDLVCDVVRLREEIIYMRLSYNTTSTGISKGNTSIARKHAEESGKVADTSYKMQSSTNMHFFSYSEHSSAARISTSFSPPLQHSISSISRDGVGVELEPFSAINGSSVFPCGDPTSTSLVDVENFIKMSTSENNSTELNMGVLSNGENYPLIARKDEDSQNEVRLEKGSLKRGNAALVKDVQSCRPEDDGMRSEDDSEKAEEEKSIKALACPRISDADLERDACRLREDTRGRNLGWGPEAHRHFALNYVSTPQKLMRSSNKRAGKRQREVPAKPKKQKLKAVDLRAEEGLKTPLLAPTTTIPSTTEKESNPMDSTYNTPKTVAKCVSSASCEAFSPSNISRQLIFDCDKGETNEKEVDKLPSGWGCEASKYFDPRTYCDDPSKAHFCEEFRTKRIQARRQIEFPSYLAYVD